MTTLRIDHEVHTYDLWEAALDGYADVPPRVFATHSVRPRTRRRPFSTEVPYLMGASVAPDHEGRQT